MDKRVHQEIIDEISKKLADKIFSEEKNLVRRAISIDGDIADIVQDIGLKTCKRVLEKSRDPLAEKKARRSDCS